MFWASSTWHCLYEVLTCGLPCFSFDFFLFSYMFHMLLSCFNVQVLHFSVLCNNLSVEHASISRDVFWTDLIEWNTRNQRMCSAMNSACLRSGSAFHPLSNFIVHASVTCDPRPQSRTACSPLAASFRRTRVVGYHCSRLCTSLLPCP